MNNFWYKIYTKCIYMFEKNISFYIKWESLLRHKMQYETNVVDVLHFSFILNKILLFFLKNVWSLFLIRE